MKKVIPEELNESIAMSRKAYRSGKKPHVDVSNSTPKRNNKKKKQQQISGRKANLKVSSVAEEHIAEKDEPIGKEWFLHDHQKCIDCQRQPIREYKAFFDHVELEPEPEEMDLKGMTDRDLRLKDKEMGLLMKLDDDELDDELRAALDREQADCDRISEDDEAFNDWEQNRAFNDWEWSPVNFMLKDLSPYSPQLLVHRICNSNVVLLTFGARIGVWTCLSDRICYL